LPSKRKRSVAGDVGTGSIDIGTSCSDDVRPHALDVHDRARATAR
jgi:hypothetical protein